MVPNLRVSPRLKVEGFISVHGGAKDYVLVGVFFSLSILTHLCRMDFSVPINWKSQLPILGLFVFSFKF